MTHTTKGMRERFDQFMALFAKEGWGLGPNQKRVLFEKFQSEAALAVSEREKEIATVLEANRYQHSDSDDEYLHGFKDGKDQVIDNLLGYLSAIKGNE